MKKIYLKPEIETKIVNAAWSVCVGSIDQGQTQQPGQGPPSGPPGAGAPKKPLF